MQHHAKPNKAEPKAAGRRADASAAGGGSVGSDVHLGEILPSGEGGPTVLCDDPVLRPHLGRPWLRAFLARQIGLPTAAPRPFAGGKAQVPAWAWECHSLTVGSTGSGKSRLNDHVLAQRMASGQSLVVLDPKWDTLVRLALRAKEAGLPPERVTILSPRAAGGAGGWNPLAAAPQAQAVTDFVAAMERSTSAWGHRLQDVLTNGCLLVAAHGLSVFELVECLRRAEYLEGLLRLPLPPSAPMACREAARFFKSEFLAWSPSARREATGPVTNKLREFLRNDFLSAVLAARRTTVDLAGLWREQGVVLIHLDRASLGEEGTRLLGGLAVGTLFRCALRASGPVPVTLSLDELATAEHFAGDTLRDILAIARSANLHMSGACQNLSQLSDGLRSSYLANSTVQTFFRLGPADARLAASALSVGTPSRLDRVCLAAEVPDRKTGAVPRTQWRHGIRDGHGNAVRVGRDQWDRLRWHGLFGDGSDPLAGLSRLSRDRLYVRAADSGEPTEVGRYVRGLKPGEWWLEGPAPLELVVSFPRPRVSGVERRGESEAAQRLTRTLMDLPVRTAVLKVAGRDPELVRIAEVGDVPVGDAEKRYLAAALRASGQTAAEIADTRRWREERAEALACGQFYRETNDGGGYRRADEEGVNDGGDRDAEHKAGPDGSLA